LQFDTPTVISNDTLNNHQPEAGALFLCGIEGLEDSADLFLRYPTTCVGDTHPDPLGESSGFNRKEPTAGHRLHRILDQVHEDLFDLRWIQVGARQTLGAPKLYQQASVGELWSKKLQCFLHHDIERGPSELRRRWSDSLKELSDDVIEPCDFPFSDIEVTVQAISDLFDSGGRKGGQG